MQCEWLGERVAAPSLRTVMRNALTKQAAGNWGPNATFRFPARGGTGGIWTAVAAKLPPKQFRLGGKAGAVSRVDIVRKVATLGDGRKVKYSNLVSTMALDGFLNCVDGADVQPMRKAAKEGLVYSSTIILGIGIRGERPERIGDKCRSLILETVLIGRLALLPRRRRSILSSDHLLQLLTSQCPRRRSSTSNTTESRPNSAFLG